MSTLQKFIMGAVALGAGYLVLSNPKGVAAAATAGKTLIGGTIAQITTGKNS